MCFGARLLLQSYQYPNLSEDTDHITGQLHGDKECPFSGITKSGIVWRKVPKSDARSVGLTTCGLVHSTVVEEQLKQKKSNFLSPAPPPCS